MTDIVRHSTDLIFIIGRQRSGTTVFRDLLARQGALDCDEIFHGAIDGPYRFYGYLGRLVAENPGLIHPEHHPYIFRNYINSLRETAKGKPLAIDVKYFGLNLIPKREDVDGTEPFIIDFMRQSKAHVIHIMRSNKLRIYTSEQLAKITGRWSVGRVEHRVTNKPKLTINSKEALAFVDSLIDQDSRVSTMLKKLPHAHMIRYEEMFDGDGYFSEEVQAIAAAIMQAEGDYSKPGNMKMNPEPLSQLVENYAEVENIFRGTKHEWMLTDLD